MKIALSRPGVKRECDALEGKFNILRRKLRKRIESKKRTLKFGILSLEQYKQRTIAIAKGEYKRRPDEPKIWFPSIQSMEHVLAEENQEFWKLISSD